MENHQDNAAMKAEVLGVLHRKEVELEEFPYRAFIYSNCRDHLGYTLKSAVDEAHRRYQHLGVTKSEIQKAFRGEEN